MSKTTYQEIPPEFDLLYKKVLQSGDRFVIPRVRRKILFISRRRKKGLTQKSLIPILSQVWASLDTETKNAWVSAGVESNLTGWKMFLVDTALRMKNDIAGYSTPNDIYQSLVGKIQIESPAQSAKIAQLHPLDYWVYRKVPKTRNQYEPVAVTESFGLPLTIEISYKSDLTEYGGVASARFFCEVLSHYQGREIKNIVSIPISLSAGWNRQTATISQVVGLARGYNAYIEIQNARGTLHFDNVALRHSGQNWARDPFCNDINQGFTKAFYQIPKHWVDVDNSDGVFFESMYYT